MKSFIHWPLAQIQRFWVLLTVVLLVVIGVLSLLPVAQLPEVPGTDKTHHFIAYCALMLPTALRWPKYWWALALCFIAYSGAIELIQPYVNRWGEWLDLAANSGGVVVGTLLGYGLRRSEIND
ncbi:MAG: hypothetical protein CR974_00805 [Gammaproteobacteria bacterium]|nr:MAG: hypothetical protein CR974_00805 [Gammaproteobacteria bacterium]